MKKYDAKDLERWGSCEAGIELAKKLAPNGATIMEMLNMDKVPNDFVHWVKERVAFSEEEEATYLSRMKIMNSTKFYYCEDIVNSSFVVRSKNIKDSCNVFGSKKIFNSKDVVESEEVENSSTVFGSMFLLDSHKIAYSSNITSCVNVYKSFNVIKSQNVFESSNVFDSSEIIRAEDATNCHFCSDCKAISNCLFCANLSNVEYHIFNKPVSKEKYEFFEKQYLKYWDGLLSFIPNWPTDLLQGMNLLTPIQDFSKWYKSIPENFWKWVRTLPNFDSLLIYDITMLPKILIDQQ